MALKIKILCSKHNKYADEDLVVHYVDTLRRDENEWEIELEIDPCEQCLEEARQQGREEAEKE